MAKNFVFAKTFIVIIVLFTCITSCVIFMYFIPVYFKSKSEGIRKVEYAYHF